MRNQKGVTLIELLIVILIMVSISALAFSLFSYGTKMERTVSNENELQREARFIMESISNAVRDGETIDSTIVYSNGELKLSSNSSVLSKHVKEYKALKLSDGRYKVTLVLENGDQKYELSTEVLDNTGKRVRY
jgi:prepilin-type N-terminal cleavage/methylation domain-containing protein